MMEFYLVSQQLEIIGIIDTYKSAIWTTRYYESGDFELYVPATAELLSLIQKRQFVVRMDDMTKAMVIEGIKLSTEADSGDYLTITGRSISSILSSRIVWAQTTYNGYVEKIMWRMVADAFIEPLILERAVSIMALGTELGITDKAKMQFTGDSVESAIQSICKSYKLGYDVLMDLANKKIRFVVYKGEDRSYGQSDNPFVVFSPDFENLISTEYSNSDAKFKNVAQIAGEGEGIARKRTVVGSASGLERFEVFVDARNQSTNSGEIDDATYLSILAQKGTEKLAALSTVESVDSEVAPNHTYVLGRDYFIGDVVEIINEYGIAMTPRVVEVIECQDEAGYTCIPTFATDD